MALLDTHVWAWSLIEPGFLSPPARETLERATGLTVSAVTFYEIAQKVRLGKWPQMTAHLHRLADLAAEQSVAVLSVTAEMALRVGKWVGNGPEIWLRMQGQYDLWQARKKGMPKVKKAKRPALVATVPA